MGTLRTLKTQNSYDEHKRNGHLKNQCPLCTSETITEFTHWRLIDNKFPYDKISSTHHMIVPVRHIIETELTQEELAELMLLKNSILNEQYMLIFEALPRSKSIPNHFHLHLIVLKEEI